MSKLPETDDFVVNLKQPQTSEKLNNTIPRPSSLVPRPQSSWLHFVQYNNAFLIVLVVCVLAFGSLTFASEEVRDATIGGQITRAEGVDNTLLLEQDFDKFNMDFKITGILEDEESYVINYSYVDFDLTSPLTPLLKEGEGNHSSSVTSPSPLQGEGRGEVWQFIEKQGARKINKPFRQDLGVYLAGQLRQEASARIKELKKIQKQEREKGETKVVQVTEYSGLIGKVLDLSTAVFPGYEPVKKVELPTPAISEQMAQRTQTNAADNLTNVYQSWVDSNPNAVADLNSGGTETSNEKQITGTSNEEPASPADGQVTETPSPQPLPAGEAGSPAAAGEGANTEPAVNNEAPMSIETTPEAGQ